MRAVLLARVDAFGGEEAVREALRLAGSRRSGEYLTDITKLDRLDEAVALWRAGARVTRHPEFARAVGVDAAARLGSSSVAAHAAVARRPREGLLRDHERRRRDVLRRARVADRRVEPGARALTEPRA
jgi:hypothetical protein